jgi:hypothetical protein
MRLFRENGAEWVDEELMLAWFANALMRGFDEHARRHPSQGDGLHLIDAKAKRVLDACAAASYRTMALRVCKTDAVGWNIAVGQVSAIAEAELARRGSEPGKGEG